MTHDDFFFSQSIIAESEVQTLQLENSALRAEIDRLHEIIKNLKDPRKRR